MHQLMQRPPLSDSPAASQFQTFVPESQRRRFQANGKKMRLRLEVALTPLMKCPGRRSPLSSTPVPCYAGGTANAHAPLHQPLPFQHSRLNRASFLIQRRGVGQLSTARGHRKHSPRSPHFRAVARNRRTTQANRQVPPSPQSSCPTHQRDSVQQVRFALLPLSPLNATPRWKPP